MSQVNDQLKAQCVLWMHELKSPTAVIRKLRYVKGMKSGLPSRSTIRFWYKNFQETGNFKGKSKNKKGPKKVVTEETVHTLSNLYKDNPRTPVRVAAREVPISKSTVHRVIRRRLKLYPYKIQLTQALKPADYPKREEFARTLLARLGEDPTYLNRILFTDEATFHVSGLVHRHNIRIWGTENPHIVQEVERNSPKVNVWCGLFHDEVIGPFFFEEVTINQANFLRMLQESILPQVRHRDHAVVFQLDGAPAHWGLDVRASLNTEFPGQWIGRDGPTPWPPRSPDVTPLDFFFWGYIKTLVYSHHIHNVNHLKERIRESVGHVSNLMLTNTWKELESRLMQLRENGGQHVEVY